MMRKNQKAGIGMMVAVMLLSGISLYAQSDSTSAIRQVNRSQIQKADGNLQNYLNRINARGQSVETLRLGKFTVLLNPLSNGQYELQVHRVVTYGKRRVISTFASLYQSGVEYSYSYDAQSQKIKQFHFICPPNSLTCWAEPSDYAIFNEFDWQQNFPSKNCPMPVFTSEEYGREYLQASCFASRDAALTFATNFVTYANRNRM
jgi:hypothetical protein